MKFLFFLVTFLISLSVAEHPRFEDFATDYERNRASMLNYEGIPAFVLSESLLAVLKRPNIKLNKYIKHDPFLDLYLVRTDPSLIPTPMGDEEKLTCDDWIRIWDPNRVYIGHIRYLAQNIDEKNQLDLSTRVGLLSTPYYEMVGIALNNSSFIGDHYLKHFTKYNDVYWDGIRVDSAVRENEIYVNNIRKGGQFLINGEIISVDGTLIKDVRKLSEKILFTGRGGTFCFQILRDNVGPSIFTEVFAKDLSKSDLPSDKSKPEPTNFRSNIGLGVNSSLVVIEVDAGLRAASAGFMVEDKILRANNVVLKDLKELQTLLSTGNDFDILIERKSDRLPSLGLDDDLGGIRSGGDGEF